MNLLMRRVRKRASTRLGRPKPPMTPTRPAIRRLLRLRSRMKRDDHDADRRRNHDELPALIERPACSMRVCEIGDACACASFPSSFRLSAICFLLRGSIGRDVLDLVRGLGERLARFSALRIAAERRRSARPPIATAQASAPESAIVHHRSPFASSAVTRLLDLGRRRAPPPAAAPRRNSARDPRSAAGRCRSSDGGP